MNNKVQCGTNGDIKEKRRSVYGVTKDASSFLDDYVLCEKTKKVYYFCNLDRIAKFDFFDSKNLFIRCLRFRPKLPRGFGPLKSQNAAAIMSESPRDALRALETALHEAYLGEHDVTSLDLIKQILAHKQTYNSKGLSNKHKALENLTVRNITRWRKKYGAPPIPGNTVRIEIAPDPAVAADLAHVLGTKFCITVDGDKVTVNTSTGEHPVNVFYLGQLTMNACQRNSIVSILRRHGVSSPSDVCDSLTTRLADDLTLLPYLKAQHLLPESLLPLCDTIAQINNGTTKCNAVYSIKPTLKGTQVKLTCARHIETAYDDATNVLISEAFARFLAHVSKNINDGLNFNTLMGHMQHLPSVGTMVEMIREGSCYLTAHFDPVVPWLERALDLWTRDKNTAFVQSFLGQVTDTGAGSICKPYHFLRGNFMECVIDAAKEHSGNGPAMMRAIIKIMNNRLKPGIYRVTETIDPVTGEVKDKYVKSLQAGAKIFDGVTCHFVPRGDLGPDSVSIGTGKPTGDAGSVLTALLAGGSGSKPVPKPELSASTFGGLGQSGCKIFEGLPGVSACIDKIMEFLKENPSATVRVRLLKQYVVAVGTVEGNEDAKNLFKQPHMIKYYNGSRAGKIGIACQEWYVIVAISRLLCAGNWNYVFTPDKARPVDNFQHVMLTQYLVDTKQHAFGPVITGLSEMMMSTEAVVDPVIGFGIQTGTTPLKAGEKREWFAAHDVPTIEITLGGVTRTYTVLPPQ